MRAHVRDSYFHFRLGTLAIGILSHIILHRNQVIYALLHLDVSTRLLDRDGPSGVTCCSFSKRYLCRVLIALDIVIEHGS